MLIIMWSQINFVEIKHCSFLNFAVINKKIKKTATENSVTNIINTRPSKEAENPQIANKHKLIIK